MKVVHGETINAWDAVHCSVHCNKIYDYLPSSLEVEVWIIEIVLSTSGW